MRRSSAAGLSLSFTGHFEAIMNRVFLPGLLSINVSSATGSRGNRSSSTYRALFHKCAADLLRVGIETECLSRQRAAELLEKCIQSLAPRPESIEATISFLTKMIISSTTVERDDVNTLEKSNNDNITDRTVLMTRRISDLVHGKEGGGGGGKGFLQPLAAVWMRPDFEVPRELYISLAASYLLPAPNAPTSSNNWEWAKMGLSTMATTATTTMTMTTASTHVILGATAGGASSTIIPQALGNQLSPLVSGPALSPPLSPLSSVS
jgi:hypothetical protein